jgi:hypothetical protein
MEIKFCGTEKYRRRRPAQGNQIRAIDAMLD